MDFGGGRGWVGSTAYVRKCVVRGLNACRKKDGRDRYINRVRSPWALPKASLYSRNLGGLLWLYETDPKIPPIRNPEYFPSLPQNTIAIPQSNVHLSHPSTSQAYFIQTPLTDTMSNDEASMVMQINSEPSKFHPVHRGL